MLAMGIAVFFLVAVALAAQIVWILYLYRSTVLVAVGFYVVVILAHAVLGMLIAKTVVGLGASGAVTAFMDQAITPRLQAATEGVRHDLAAAQSDRDAVGSKVTDLQNDITQAKADQEQLKQAIEEKKVSDIYVLSRILRLRAQGDLQDAHDQLVAFMAKYPSSSLAGLAQGQLDQLNSQMAAAQTQKQQEDAQAAAAAAQARADLLARAGKGEVTLSEMRRALIGKTRAQVIDLLGKPAATDSDSWAYDQQMILNPLTSEKTGLLVFFFDGMVQSVDYNRNVAQ
jgi:hypothetical protein